MIMFNINDIVSLSQKAWDAIMEIYSEDFEVEYKKDDQLSPLTIADKKANDVILKWLSTISDLPIMTEEWKVIPYEQRSSWKGYWLVDPLDWTKEFIKRNWEFTVNIALIENNYPVAWVIHAPALWVTYFAEKWKWAFKIDKNWKIKQIKWKKTASNEVNVIVSRSHKWELIDKFISDLEQKHEKINYISSWSSLKICLVAEGEADIYPRLAPTMEWDTWAGQAIAEEAWVQVLQYDRNERVRYNKEDLLNPFFVVKK